jgi:four helix bundle protein
MGRQILRSATSVAANYRAVCRARTPAEFRAKLGIVVEEADETVFWLDLLADSGTLPRHRMSDLRREANEVLAIFAASFNTARKRASRKQ